MDDKAFVKNYLGELMFEEVTLRIENGSQTIGQAFMNAGDRFDWPYSWELDFDTMLSVDDWGGVRKAIESL